MIHISQAIYIPYIQVYHISRTYSNLLLKILNSNGLVLSSRTSRCFSSSWMRLWTWRPRFNQLITMVDSCELDSPLKKINGKNLSRKCWNFSTVKKNKKLRAAPMPAWWCSASHRSPHHANRPWPAKDKIRKSVAFLTRLRWKQRSFYGRNQFWQEKTPSKST